MAIKSMYFHWIRFNLMSSIKGYLSLAINNYLCLNMFSPSFYTFTLPHWLYLQKGTEMVFADERTVSLCNRNLPLMTTLHTKKKESVIQKCIRFCVVCLPQQGPHVTEGIQSKRQHGIKILMERCQQEGECIFNKCLDAFHVHM